MFYNRFSQLSLAITISGTLMACGGADPGQTIGKQIMGAPSDLSVQVVSPTELLLSWSDNASSEVSYRIERAVGDADFSEVGTTGSNINTFQDTEVTLNQIYTYRVRAANQTDFSEFSNEESVDTAIPAAPSAGMATSINSDPLRIELDWTDNAENETSFSIKRGPEGSSDDSQFTLIAENLPVDTTSFVDEDELFSFGDGYCYQVFAVNQFGPSTKTTQVCTSFAPPAPPTHFIAQGISTSEIQLTWEDQSNNETGFYLMISSANSGSFKGLKTTERNVESVVAEGLELGSCYDFRVRATNNFGNTIYAEVFGACTTGIPPL